MCVCVPYRALPQVSVCARVPHRPLPPSRPFLRASVHTSQNYITARVSYRLYCTYFQGKLSTKFALSGPSATQLGDNDTDTLAEGEMKIIQLHNELRDGLHSGLWLS